MADLERDRLAGLVEEPPDFGLVVGGGQRQNSRPAGRRSSQSGDEPEHDAELETFPVGAASSSRG